jgi:hypothetical protein
MLASDVNNPEFAGATNPDAALVVTFYEGSIQNNYKTEQEGRPIFDSVDMVKIFTPGNSLNIIDTIARDWHRDRFPVQWARYKNNKNDESISGTPLSSWPILSKAQVENLRAIKFFTVENIASATDAMLSNIGMIGGMNVYELRKRAIAYLDQSNVSAKANEHAREIEKRDAEIAEMKALLNKLLEKQAEAEPKKPGRKKAAPEVETAPEKAEETTEE